MRQVIPDTVPLALRGEAVLAKAVAQQPAERRLATTMANGRGLRRTGVGRPDDIEAGLERDTADDCARFAPNDETANPEPRLAAPGLRRDRESRAGKEVMLHEPSPTSDPRREAGRLRHRASWLRAP